MILRDFLDIDYPNNYLRKAISTFCYFKAHELTDDIEVLSRYKAKDLLLLPNIGHKVLRDVQIHLHKFNLDFIDKPEFVPKMKEGKVVYMLGPCVKTKEAPLFLAGYNYALFKHGIKE